MARAWVWYLKPPRLLKRPDGGRKELVDWFNQSVSEETHHPLLLIGIFIVVFLAIHPF
jgi:hypothetical protein